MKLVAVGSTNPVKVGAVEKIIQQIWPDTKVFGVDVPSGISEQPFSEEETMLGATNRARLALQQLGADIGVGLEGGVQETPYGMFLCHWVVALDQHGKIGRGCGTKLEIPAIIALELKQGKELGPVMDAYLGMHDVKKKHGAVGTFTNNMITRQEAFEHGLIYALAKFVTPHYGS